jgi:hypothetical protein
MDSRVTYDELQHQINLLFNYNPPSLVPAPESTSLCPKLAPPPSIFYDKHLDERLTLKRVVIMPSLTARLGETADKTLHSIQQRKIRLPTYGPITFFPTEEYRALNQFTDPVIDAVSVAWAYRCSTAEHCMIIASTLFLFPHSSEWNMALNWNQKPFSSSDDRRALEEDFVLYLLHIPGESPNKSLSIPETVWNAMDLETRERLPHVAQRFPILAVWQIYAMSRECQFFLHDMERIASAKDFLHDKCLTAGHTAPLLRNLSYAPDATSTLWDDPGSTDCEIHISPSSPSTPVGGTKPPSVQVKVNFHSKVLQTKMSIGKMPVRTQRGTETDPKSDDQWPIVTVPGQKSSMEHTARSLIQHVRLFSIHLPEVFK